MIEFIVVDHGTVHPNACLICGSATGPLVDTHVEKWGDHIYICRMCVTRAARVLGLVKGKKQDELLQAAAGLEQKDAEIAVIQGELAEARLEAGGQRAAARELQARLQEQQGRIKTMAHIATEVERQSRELVETAAGPVTADLAQVA